MPAKTKRKTKTKPDFQPLDRIAPDLFDTKGYEETYQEPVVTPREFREYVRAHGYDDRARAMAVQIAECDYAAWKGERP